MRKVDEGSASTNVQTLLKSERSTYQLRRSLESRSKEANRRLEALKKAGYQGTQFVQEHRKGFKVPAPEKYMDRKQVSKKLAEVNRFLASEQSTPRGMKSSRKNLIESLNESEKIDVEITEENLDRFLEFMKYYREHVKEQTKIPSDFVANELFSVQERLHLTKEDVLKSMEDIYTFKHELDKMSVEDMFPDGKVNNRVRFKVADYLDKLFY